MNFHPPTKAIKSTLGSALILVTVIISGPATAYYHDPDVGVTDSPTEFAQYTSPLAQVSFSSSTPGNYGPSYSFSNNGYGFTAKAFDSSSNPTNTTVIAPGRLSTENPGDVLAIFTGSGTPSAMGASLRLVDATGQTTSGTADFSLVLHDGTTPLFPLTFTVPFDATTGFKISTFFPGLQDTFYIGGFLTQLTYNYFPGAYFYAFDIKPNAANPTLYGALDTVTAGASTLFHSAPEIDALAGTGALTLLGFGLALAGERRRRT